MLTFILVWLAIGLIAGFLASPLVGGGRGIAMDMFIGLLGAVVGGFILGTVLGYQADSFISHVIVAFVGAVILLMFLRLVDRPRRILR
jgi:uncharacterized membrane protein YeaQ/YmgE (transglycosylase-associated protein family)